MRPVSFPNMLSNMFALHLGIVPSSVSGGSSLTAQQSPRSLRPRIHSLISRPSQAIHSHHPLQHSSLGCLRVHFRLVLVSIAALCRTEGEASSDVEVCIGWNLYSTVSSRISSVCVRKKLATVIKRFYFIAEFDKHCRETGLEFDSFH